jgi:NDP-sugar pyrophosphorylase family protein
MVSIGNRTLIERVISNLAESGVEKVYVSLNYLGDQIRDHLKQAPEKNLEIEFVEEKSKLGTAGALGLVNYDLDEPLLVINGDILTSVDLSSLYFFHRQGDCVITVGIVEYLMKIPYGVITFADNRVAQLVEKPSHCVHINAGIYVIDPNLLSTIPENTRVDMTDIIETALQNGEKVTPFPIFEQWIDIGTPEDLERANDLMRLEE